PPPTLFPYTTLFRSSRGLDGEGDGPFAELLPFPSAPPAGDPGPENDATELVPVDEDLDPAQLRYQGGALVAGGELPEEVVLEGEDRKSTRLNSSHVS